MGNLLFVAGTSMIDMNVGNTRKLGVKTNTRKAILEILKQKMHINMNEAESMLSVFSKKTRGRVYRIDQNMKIAFSGCK